MLGFAKVPDRARVAQCFECGCLIVDDDEGANRALHVQAMHAPKRKVVR